MAVGLETILIGAGDSLSTLVTVRAVRLIIAAQYTYVFPETVINADTVLRVVLVIIRVVMYGGGSALGEPVGIELGHEVEGAAVLGMAE